ncbi:MAG: signal peptidase I [Desulfobacteraceae bacterium]|nr:signal peptidase I [Desulfobacteraceae bacterium]
MNNKPRKWWVAGLLSLIEPGLGQIYNGQARKGFIFLAIPLLLFPSIILCVLIDKILLFLILFIIFAVAYYIIVAADAILTARKLKPDYTLKKYNKIIVYIGVAALVLVVNTTVSSYIKNNYVQAYKIPSTSNKPTLLVGDHILVDRNLSAKNPDCGDIIVFKYPKDPTKDFVKRIVAIGGDVVEIYNKELLINNKAVEEDYIIHNDSNIYPTRDNFGPVTVPKNSYFVMGDNRDNSHDSRFWGFIEKSEIKGTVKNIYWSWDKKKFNARWNRIGLKVE